MKLMQGFFFRAALLLKIMPLLLMAATVPGVPTNVQLVQLPSNGPYGIGVYFSPPASNGGDSIIDYKVEAVQDASQNCIATTTTRCDLTSLPYDSTYTFRVRARNAIGFSPPSLPTDSFKMLYANTQTVKAVPGNGMATVSWTRVRPPSCFGGWSYNAISNPGGSSCMPSSGALNCTVTGLVNGTSYTFTVQNIQSAHTGTDCGQNGGVAFTTTSGPVTPLASLSLLSGGKPYSLKMIWDGSKLRIQIPPFEGAKQISIQDLSGRVLWKKNIQGKILEVAWFRGSSGERLFGVYIVRLKSVDVSNLGLIVESRVVFR